MNLKAFWIRWSSGLGLGLVVSGMTALVINGLNYTTGWSIAIFGSLAYAIAEGFRD